MLNVQQKIKITMEKILIGTNPLIASQNKPSGQFIQIDGEEFYEIKNFWTLDISVLPNL